MCTQSHQRSPYTGWLQQPDPCVLGKGRLEPWEVHEQPLLLQFLFQMPKTKPFHRCQNDYFDIYETFTLGKIVSILTYSENIYFLAGRKKFTSILKSFVYLETTSFGPFYSFFLNFKLFKKKKKKSKHEHTISSSLFKQASMRRHSAGAFLLPQCNSHHCSLKET